MAVTAGIGRHVRLQQNWPATSVLGSINDIPARSADVCFAPDSGLNTDMTQCPFRARMRHMRCNTLFDHFVGNGKNAGRDREAKGLSSFEIEHELELGRFHHW
jgi:hypothetical protein